MADTKKEKLVELLLTFHPKNGVLGRHGCQNCGSHVHFEPRDPEEVELLADKILESLVIQEFSIELKQLKETLETAEKGIEKGHTDMIFLIRDNIYDGNRTVHVDLRGKD
ncbi:hypothetical protein LCGC14_0403580 [marine sediment metagenome]|uniref:Uncharacterized protein n=1 Tax=marine sediment metagenome TaxID=412755 RepID=A0A0F9SW99_9ZZZZ